MWNFKDRLSNSWITKNINVTYQVYTNGRLLPNVVNLNDYAGIYGKSIERIQVQVIKNNMNIQFELHRNM